MKRRGESTINSDLRGLKCWRKVRIQKLTVDMAVSGVLREAFLLSIRRMQLKCFKKW
jgi:hypothetical protein